jgi:hypothetical protein
MPRSSPFFREIPRTRHELTRRQLKLLRPFFRYSRVRDAYVLRLVGRRRGPVLRLKRHPRPAPIVRGGGPIAPKRAPAVGAGASRVPQKDPQR